VLRKERSEAVPEARGAELVWSALHSFFLFLHLMQFGRLESQKHILKLCFKFINLAAKRLAFLFHFFPATTLPSVSLPRKRPP